VATDLANPDFVALGRAFGLGAWRVAATEEFASVLRAARAHAGPALIELVTSIRDISPGKRLPAE
jgi:acetolactate synthase-1/2/3 large subunit